MTANVIDLRKGERFVVLEPIYGTFGPSDMTVRNLGVGGLQIVHAQPLRIGTRGRVVFQHRDVAVNVHARLLWSHLSRTPDESGKFLYVSGVILENAEAPYAAAVNSLFRMGVTRPDTQSMDRKRERVAEREEARKSQMKMVPLPPSTE
ncbi:MAG TPA: hypothetical protein VJZ00_06770 [Thermoanaerobaculia bacterium]|nr:hypothetical protein [Thermoanaerobaculia bacterium]